MPAGPHGPPGPPPPYPQRRQHDYHYQHMPPQMPYGYPHPAHAYYGPPQHHYPQQWYQPHPQQHYQPMPYPPRTFQPQSPLVVSSPIHAQPFVPQPRQHPLPPPPPPPVRTPIPDPPTPSTGSQVIISPSTTPTSTSIGTPTAQLSAPVPKPPTPAPATPQTPSLPAVRMAYYPKLPWYSVPDEPFPSKLSRPRRRKTAQLSSDALELPVRLSSGETQPEPEPVLPAVATSPRTPAAKLVADPLVRDASTTSSPATENKRSATKPVVPVVPAVPNVKSPTPKVLPALAAPADVVPPAPALGAEEAPIEASTTGDATAVSPPETKPAAPKSWAELLRAKNAAAASNAVAAPAPLANGIPASKSGSLTDALTEYEVGHESKISFLEPRGLVNTGNMCYMNSILQVLVFCKPFYEFLDQVGKRAVHSFKSDTPLIEAMIMFMREFSVIDSAASVDQLRLRLKDNELEKYGESFIPEYVYDVIKTLPRFASMRRGHQQDAEEFLGFLLEGLHDECAHVMKKAAPKPTEVDNESTISEDATTDGWLEVGPKQKASVTQESGSVATESPITKIFGGKLRSELRVSGLKNSVTLEPYQPLQLDIGSPEISNITQALKAITNPETIRGEFRSSRGPVNAATKQVFIETLPPVLILHLKRFQYDNTGGTQKIWKKIGYPLELEIPKEVLPPNSRAKLSLQPGGIPKYRLAGVVYHHGKNASGGHYTADLRRQEGREWIRIDDTVIRRVRSEDVAGEGGEEDPKVLAAALESHKRNPSINNIFQAGFEQDGQSDAGDDEQGWSQVNGPSPTANNKKWSGIVNSTGASTPTTTGKATPKEGGTKFSVKDNKVAYILFYERMR
ncbi:hypothetical protein FH972_023979 [Carpinus fangiana]|uniref:Ubiquitin carboxyl-terminal hydrolase n=1 Tax=Carpinus fangiana TaxID=176857 RepID=A0A5N6KX08_9ROSI|nr:hypothetical protein FH972_023979 [Carpinus fangiana]